MAKTKDQKKAIRAMYNQVQENKAAIANAENGRYLTDGNFRVNNSSAIINLKTASNPLQLRDAYADLLEKSKSKAEANAILGISDESPTHMGASIAEWTADFKTSIARINKVAMLRQVEQDEAFLLTMDPAILHEIKMDEIAARNNAISATKAQAGTPVSTAV